MTKQKLRAIFLKDQVSPNSGPQFYFHSNRVMNIINPNIWIFIINQWLKLASGKCMPCADQGILCGR